jgi:hypothetical protein
MDSEEQYTLEQPLYEKVRHFNSETNPRGCQSSNTGHIYSTASCETARDSQGHVHGAGSDRPGLDFDTLELSNPRVVLDLW